MNEPVYIGLHPSALNKLDAVCERFNRNHDEDYDRSSVLVFVMTEVEKLLIAEKFNDITGGTDE